MTHDATDRFMRDVIGGCYGAERFFLLHHTMYDHRPVFSGNTKIRLFRPWPSMLEKRSVDSNPRRGKEEGENWRQSIRHPSVPVYCFQPPSQQASRVDRGFDRSITEGPLLYPSSDGSRLCPSIAEPTPSVPHFALALSLSRTWQTSSGALSRSNTASLVQETHSSQLDIRSPFLLDKSLLKVPFLIGCTK